MRRPSATVDHPRVRLNAVECSQCPEAVTNRECRLPPRRHRADQRQHSVGHRYSLSPGCAAASCGPVRTAHQCRKCRALPWSRQYGCPMSTGTVSAAERPVLQKQANQWRPAAICALGCGGSGGHSHHHPWRSPRDVYRREGRHCDRPRRRGPDRWRPFSAVDRLRARCDVLARSRSSVLRRGGPAKRYRCSTPGAVPRNRACDWQHRGTLRALGGDGMRIVKTQSSPSGFTVAGWQVPRWLGWMILLIWLGALLLLRRGADPWWGTKWAWFWALLSPLSLLTVPAFLLLSGPPPGVPQYSEPGRRLSGGWAFLLVGALSSAIPPMVMLR